MGNSNTKESRPDGDDDGAQGRRRSANGDPVALARDLARDSGPRSRNRSGRPEINIFGLGSSSSRDRERQDAPFERRETRQEREARKLEKERAARAKERERSIREEHVDGGYLVTLGTYTGTEDFSKPVVRQLQVQSPTRLLSYRDPALANHVRDSRLRERWRLSGAVSTTGLLAGTSTNL